MNDHDWRWHAQEAAALLALSAERGDRIDARGHGIIDPDIARAQAHATLAVALRGPS